MRAFHNSLRSPVRTRYWILIAAGSLLTVNIFDPVSAAAGVEIRWVNIDGPPNWVFGQLPRAKLKNDWRGMRLAPGQNVTLRIPALADLRLVSSGRRLAARDLELATSDGSGLFVNTSTPDSDALGHIVVARRLSQRFIKITRPAQFSDSVEFAAFVTARTSITAGRRRVIPMQHAAAVVRRGRAEQAFWRIGPDITGALSIAGPATVIVNTHYVYPSHAETAYVSYRINTRLDGETWESLEFETTPNLRDIVYINDEERRTGRRQLAYIAVPPGEHQLTFDANAEVVVQALTLDDRNYLLPFNAPKIAADVPQPRGDPVLGYWQIPESDLSKWASGTIAEREQTAFRLARDNRRRGGGLLAANLLEQTALQYPDDPRLAAMAQAFFARYTQYRQLLPQPKATPHQHALMWFASQQKINRVVQFLATDSKHDSFSLLESGHFFDLEPSAELTFPIPARLSDSRLRITVALPDAMGPTTFQLFFDDGPPVSLRLAPADIPILAQTLAPDIPITALDSASLGQLTLSASFTQQRRPAPLTRAAHAELKLAQNVKTVRIVNASQALRVSVHYRADRWYALTETEHADALRRAGPQGSFAQLKTLFADDEARVIPSGPDTYYGIQVGAFSQPLNAHQLATHLRSRNFPVAEQAVPGPSGNPLTRVLVGPFASHAAADATLQELKTREAGLPRDAPRNMRVTSYSVAGTSETDLERDLASHRIPLVRWLKSQRNAFRRSLTSMPPRIDVSATDAVALGRLVRTARKLEDGESWFAALEVWRRLANAHSRELRSASVLGQYRALMQLDERRLAMAHLKSVFHGDPDPVVRELAFDALREAYLKHVDERSLQTLLATAVLNDPTLVNLHRVVENLLASGRANDASTLALAMAPSDRPIEKILEASYQQGSWRVFDAALAQLNHDEIGHFWSGYRAQADGDYQRAMTHWRQAGEQARPLRTALAQGLNIATELRASENGRRVQATDAWKRWEADHPGPRRWRNASQLIRSSAGGASLHWPELDGYRQVFRATVAQPLRLRVYGPKRLKISARLVHDASATEPVDGWLEIHRGRLTQRFPINRSQPQPTIDIAGDDAHKPGPAFHFVYEVPDGVHEISVMGRPADILVQAFVSRPRLPLTVLPWLTQQTLAAQLAKPVAGGRSSDDATPAAKHRTDPGGVAMAFGDTADPFLRRVALYQALTGIHERRAQDRFASTSMSDQQVQRLLADVVWQAEQQPERFAELLAQAERLYAQHPDVPGLADLKRRLDGQAAWRPVRNIQYSAGARYAVSTGWDPETPGLRARKPLLQSFGADEQLLVGGRELGINLSGTLSDSIDMRLALATIAFLPIEPMTVYYLLDGGHKHRVDLGPEVSSQDITIPLSPGLHTLRIGIDTPLANQYLRVGLRDGAGRDLFAHENRRLYHIATRDEPLRFSIKGPAWLRIDERIGNTVQHRYRYVERGWQTLALAPDGGHHEALFRIFQRVKDHDQKLASPRRAAGVAAIAPFAITVPTHEAVTHLAGIEDLMRHRRGGWTVHAGAVDRRNIDEDEIGDSERFLELGAIHRHRDPERAVHLRTTFLGRARDAGGATLGIRERVDYRPDHLPFDFRLDGQVFAQRPGGQVDGTEWSAGVRAQASRTFMLTDDIRHRPYVRLFARYLSLEGQAVASQGRVDQDIFTRYKADHRYGFSLGDTFSHRPWADTQWYGGPSMMSNEDFDPFDPDYVQVRAGWKQLAWDWVVDTRYQYRRYFADDDRRDGADRHQVRLSLAWDPVPDRVRKWHLDFAWTHDFSSSDNSLRLLLSRDMGSNNTTRDYYPGEVAFRDVRRQRTAHRH